MSPANNAYMVQQGVEVPWLHCWGWGWGWGWAGAAATADAADNDTSIR